MTTTNQNIFEKYGIKDVADVTFYRIEKKEETFESIREFNVASVLKGAVELRTVYPMVDGVGGDEGFEAYVFTDADIITGVNYDCDDAITATITVKGKLNATDSNADAYDPITTYEPISNPTGNPQNQDYYEKTGEDTYSESTDQTVDESKTYYRQIVTPDFKEKFSKSYTLAQLQAASDVDFSSGYPVYVNQDTQIPISSAVVEEDYTVSTRCCGEC